MRIGAASKGETVNLPLNQSCQNEVSVCQARAGLDNKVANALLGLDLAGVVNPSDGVWHGVFISARSLRVNAMQCEEPVADGRRTHAKLHQAVIVPCGPWHSETPVYEVLRS